MKKTFLGLVVIAGLVRTVSAQIPDSLLGDLRVDVVYLASDYLEGRATGSHGALLASEYIANRFERLGLSPHGTDGWYQNFQFDTYPNPHDSSSVIHKTGRNVIGYLDAGALETVVVGAHYDHLGYGGPDSRAPGDSAIHNGADDNASGVAGMLEIARQLKHHGMKSNNVLFVAFSGEELGLFGSKYFVNHPTVDLDHIKYMVNLDMVGRLRKSLIVGGAGTSPVWIPLLEKTEHDGYAIKIDSSGLGPSDHASFYLKHIPVLFLFTGQHADYHKPSDDSPKINYSGIYEVATYASDVIESLDRPEAIAFTKTRDEDTHRPAAFKVTLGVMPDYAYQGKGLRIDAVLADRPAARAGLQDGDVVVELGGVPVGNIYSYMDALSKFNVGDQVDVVVRRGDHEVKTRVTF